MRALIMLAAAAVSLPDNFSRTVEALSAPSPKSAQVLAVSGARPAEGEPDLADRWRGKTRITYRDRVLGPVYRRVALPSGKAIAFEQTFFAGRMARVAVVAVDRTPFGLSVTDDEGAAQCPDAARQRCDWTPAWTSRFRISVENKAPTAASFYVVMQ